MPQNPYAVRKKRARRIKKLVRWHEKRAESESAADKSGEDQKKSQADKK